MNLPTNSRILLIDDTPSIHEDFRKLLVRRTAPELDATEASLFGKPVYPARRSFELDQARHGREGVAMVRAALESGRPYAVAFVDMRMPPGWDGVETIERLWAIDPDVQVVICTAYSDHAWDEVMARLDVRDRLLVVKKPFDPIEVSQLAGTLTAKWDATRQAAAQIERLTASEAALRESHRELEVLVHSMSHDLRAPLTAMSSFSQLLAEELGGSAAGKALHYLSRIRANAGVGEQLINDLLVLDGVSRMALSMEPVELGALARELLAELQQAEPQRRVSVDVQPGLWANVDRRLARIALGHLIANAWHSTSGRATGCIEAGSRTDATGEAVFFVRDNGRGFETAHAAQLFQTPQRLHSGGGPAGSGIGLVAVGRVVSRHGGRIWAESAPDAGATFYFTLAGARTAPVAT